MIAGQEAIDGSDRIGPRDRQARPDAMRWLGILAWRSRDRRRIVGRTRAPIDAVTLEELLGYKARKAVRRVPEEDAAEDRTLKPS